LQDSCDTGVREAAADGGDSTRTIDEVLHAPAPGPSSVGLLANTPPMCPGSIAWYRADSCRARLWKAFLRSVDATMPAAIFATSSSTQQRLIQ